MHGRLLPTLDYRRRPRLEVQEDDFLVFDSSGAFRLSGDFLADSGCADSWGAAVALQHPLDRAADYGDRFGDGGREESEDAGIPRDGRAAVPHAAG